jgi:VWFA-related protein
MRTSGVALAAAVLFAAVLGLRAQQPAPFRAGVAIVDVDVSVLDQNRLPIKGLTADDFTVLEDGKPRPVVAFTPIDLASREMPPAPWMADISPDTQTNDLQREGRLVVILLDRSIALGDVPNARRVAEEALNQLRPADLAAVVYTEYGIPQNFTSDRRRLLAAVQRPSVGLPEDDNGESSSCFCGTCSLDRIAAVADAVRDVRQRRKILFVIGSNIAVTARGGCSAAVSDSRSRAFRAIGAANLTAYVFDPGGIRTLSANANSRRPMSSRAAWGNMARLGDLRALPELTGGRALLNNDPEDSLPAIFRESNSYYVLGFTPAHADGKFHDISVKVRQSHAIVQARRGYVAAGGKPRSTPAPPKDVKPSLHEAMSGLWPKAGVPLTIAATPVAMPGLNTGAVVVMIGMDAESSAGVAVDGNLNVLVGAFDRNGRVLARTQGAVRATRRNASSLRPGYDLVTQLELKPGRYEIRAAVENAVTGDTGSVYTYVDVPDFQKEFVSLSGIVLSTIPQTPADPVGSLRASLPVVPTLRRDFARSDRVNAWVQIYQGFQRFAMAGYFLAEIRNEQDSRVFHQEVRMLPEDVGDNRAIAQTLELPLDGLNPGQYLLAMEMKQGNNSAKREIRFTVK